MIEGLHVDVPSAELKELLIKRLHHHESRISFYTKQLAEIEKVDDALRAEAQQYSKVSNASGPVDSIRTSIQRHKDQCIYYRFVSEHLVPGETYRLEESDLRRLGFSPDRY